MIYSLTHFEGGRTMTPSQIVRAITDGQLCKIHHARMVRRWHANAFMAQFYDTVRDHGYRCNDLVEMFWETASDELRYESVYHDYGEWKTGDIPGPTKAAHPEFAEMIERMETQARSEIGLPRMHLDDIDARRLHFVDKLDAYDFVRRNNPTYSKHSEWVNVSAWLAQEADALGVSDKAAKYLPRER